ncbi:MAG: glycosyltransferase [Deltaproteobacteria bacterium]|nr:glycosyltransferase [Deltaproteobacteria bacterium]
MTVPQVSVIIPTHNRVGFLSTAIGSVLQQSFQNFEMLVVDDASTDETANLRERFPDTRIRWLRHDKPRGGAAARNTGIVHSRGEYIAFLDDDDEWFPEKLARQMEVMLNSAPEVAAVYTGYLVVDRASGKISGRMTPKLSGDLSQALLAANPIGGTSCMLLKRSCLEQVGLFDESLPSFQDRDLWIRISRKFHFDYVPDALLNYYVHGKKVWTNLEALERGLETMLRKYGSSAAFRKSCSGRYLFFGIKFCEADQIGKGKAALLKAIRLDPYRIKPYIYFLLTLLGPKIFMKARESKGEIFVGLGVTNS